VWPDLLVGKCGAENGLFTNSYDRPRGLLLFRKGNSTWGIFRDVRGKTLHVLISQALCHHFPQAKMALGAPGVSNHMVWCGLKRGEAGLKNQVVTKAQETTL
jgi:hypothetical protein